jgi:hypothetical protein
MAIATTPTLLGLDDWAAIMGISPWAFNQLDVSYLGASESCDVWYQHTWQRGQTLTREDVARAVADAEAMIAHELTYWPAPKFTIGEKISYPHPYQAAAPSYWRNNLWRLKDVKTKWGYVNIPGIEARTTLGETVAITLSDSDGDGYDDWFTSDAVSTSVMDLEEIAAYLCDADRPDSVVSETDECWRLNPVRVNRDLLAGTITVSGPIWLLVKPELALLPAPSVLNPTDAAMYVDAIKVVRRYVDTGTQGEVVFEQSPCGAAPCETLEVCACFGERDAKMGYVIPQAVGDSGSGGTCTSCTYAPDFVRIHYLSGYRLEHNGSYRMDRLHAQMVARLAAALLPNKSCVTCSETQIDHWRGVDEDLPFDEMVNPFGMQRGAVWAWKRVMEMNSRKLAGAIL